MSDTDNRKIKAAACELSPAKYWGMCGETILNAVEIMKVNPCITVEAALKAGFKRSAKLLEPMPIIKH